MPLCLRDAALKRYYTPPSDGEDISLALFDAIQFKAYDHFQLVSHLLNLGAVVRQRHIIESMHCCRADILGFLLTSWPERKMRLRRDSLYLPNERNGEVDTYNGESFGILWELVRAKNVRLKDYEAMVILLSKEGSP